MISAKDIGKSYGTPVLTMASCVFRSDQVTFLMGANGAGKTTFFKCLLELEKHDGSFDFDGQPHAMVRQEVFTAFDDSPLYPRLNGYANVELLLGGRIARRDVDDAWKLGDLRASVALLRKPVRAYSNGQRKRLYLAAAVLSRPKYLILDEVASGLDLETMDAAVRAINLLRPGAVIIASGHQFDFYTRIVDRVVLLDNGHIKEVDWHGDLGASGLERIYRTHTARSH